MASCGIDKSRLEAFSDGVLAVVITLLVLDLHVDPTAPETLGAQVAHEWPSFAAYAVSFFVVGVIWVNHHALFALVSGADRSMLFVNLLLLMFVTAIPFTTASLSGFLTRADGSATTAVLLYGAAMEGMALSFTLLLARMARSGLTVRPVGREEARRAVRRFGFGALIYPVVTAIGLLSPVAMLVLYALLTGYYVREQTPILGAAETHATQSEVAHTEAAHTEAAHTDSPPGVST